MAEFHLAAWLSGLLYCALELNRGFVNETINTCAPAFINASSRRHSHRVIFAAHSLHFSSTISVFAWQRWSKFVQIYHIKLNLQ